MRIFWPIALPLLTVVLSFINPALSAPQQKLMVWVNEDNSVSDLSLQALKDIFHGDTQTWSDGERIVIFVPPKGSPIRRAMLSTIYSMTEGRFQQFWLAKTYQFDVSSPPKEVGQNSILEALLKSTRGGITVLHSSEVLNGSKVLRIDGLSAEQKGYPLLY